MDWSLECKKTAMWPGWADSKRSQILGLGGAENPQAGVSPGRIQPVTPLPLRTLLIGQRVLWEAESRAAPPTGARGLGHQALLPPGAASSAQPPTWSCSASRLRIGAPTTCSAPLPRKLGGREEREEREEETGSLHTPSCPPLRAARARDRRHCSSCRLTASAFVCHLRRPTVRTRGAALRTDPSLVPAIRAACKLSLLFLSSPLQEEKLLEDSSQKEIASTLTDY